MRDKLNQKSGFAIIYVVFFLFILSFMGTAMYLYSVTSLRSVRYLSDRKKAEYLAQAGVEAGAYAYQQTFTSTNANDPWTKLRSNTTDDGHVIESNDVYLLYRSGKYEFVDKAEAESNKNKVIGKYSLTIITQTVSEPIEILKEVNNISQDGKTFKSYISEIRETQRLFEAKGFVLDSNLTTIKATATKKAYMSEPVQGKGKYYDDTGTNAGIIDGSRGNGTKPIKYIDDDGEEQTTQVPVAKNENFDIIGEYKTGSTLTYKVSLFNNIPFIGNYIGVNFTIPINLKNETVPVVMGYTSGNMILDAPSTGVVKFKQNQSNMVSLIGKNNLFVNTDIDVTPSKSCFNILFLRGNNIVINGDIEIYVYGYTRSTFSLFQNVTTLATALSGNYCLSTVVIGTSDQDTANVIDPYSGSIYQRKIVSGNSTTYKSGYGRCGKVYFGGNVFVNIEVPNVGVYRYRAFSAGDTFYYDDNLPQAEGGREGYGIDLLKYFFDYSIATKKYSDNVLTRFAEVMGMYYSSIGTDSAITAYVTGESETGIGVNNINYNAMRKIDRNQFVGIDSLSSLIPPSQNDLSSLVWVKD